MLKSLKFPLLCILISISNANATDTNKKTTAKIVYPDDSINVGPQNKQMFDEADSLFGKRSYADINLVFQKSKGRLYMLYNKARRKDPGLQGKVMLRLTIKAKGNVSDVTILSSELGNKELERKIKKYVKTLKFKATDGKEVTFNYPVEFK